MASERAPISILIASPSAMNSKLMATALNRQSRFRALSIVSTATEVREVVKTEAVEIALIRDTLTDGPLSGFRALRHLREDAPQVKTILLLDNPEPNLVFDAFRAGAKGIFCPSQSDFKVLCRCVDRVHSGQIWAKSSELSYVLDMFAKIAPMRVVDPSGIRLLTKREEDVVRLLGDGLQNREIARELNLSEHTVKNYLFHVFDKLGVSSRVELILYAVSCSKRLPLTSVETNEDEAAIGAGRDGRTLNRADAA